MCENSDAAPHCLSGNWGRAERCESVQSVDPSEKSAFGNQDGPVAGSVGETAVYGIK